MDVWKIAIFYLLPCAHAHKGKGIADCRYQYNNVLLYTKINSGTDMSLTLSTPLLAKVYYVAIATISLMLM